MRYRASGPKSAQQVSKQGFKKGLKVWNPFKRFETVGERLKRFLNIGLKKVQRFGNLWNKGLKVWKPLERFLNLGFKKGLKVWKPLEKVQRLGNIKKLLKPLASV